jgi:hypothetical protein
MNANEDLGAAIRSYRMHVVAHRLRKFGFEPSINKLSTDDLRVLALMLYPHQTTAILREIARRGDCNR